MQSINLYPSFSKKEQIFQRYLDLYLSIFTCPISMALLSNSILSLLCYYSPTITLLSLSSFLPFSLFLSLSFCLFLVQQSSCRNQYAQRTRVKWSENIRREMKRGEKSSAANWSAGETVSDVCNRLAPHHPPSKPRTPFANVTYSALLAAPPAAPCILLLICFSPPSSRRHLIATTTFSPKSSLWLGAGALGRWRCGTNVFSTGRRNDLGPLTLPRPPFCSHTPQLLPGCCSWSGHPAIFQHFRNKIFNNLPRRPLSASTFKLPSGCRRRTVGKRAASGKRRATWSVHQLEDVVGLVFAKNFAWAFHSAMQKGREATLNYAALPGHLLPRPHLTAARVCCVCAGVRVY